MRSNFRLWLIPRTQDLFFVLFFVAVLALGTRMLNLDGDLPRHLLMGKYVLENRTVPTTELFIYPYIGQPYVPHEWLTDVLFYLIYSCWGWAGLVLLAAFLLAITFTLLYRGLADRLQIRLLIMILVAWGAIATSLNWAIRPHLISMCILSLWLMWADDLQRGKKFPVWLFPAVMLLWSNVHGEFIAGILVLAAYAFGWLVEYLFDRPQTELNIGKNIWLAFILSTAASLLNPSGAGPWLSIFGFVNNDYLMSRMVEANAPNFQNPDMLVYFSLLAMSIVLLAIKNTRLSLGQGFLLAGFSVMSLMAIRNIHLYGIVAPFVLADTLEGIRSYPVINRLELAMENLEGQSKWFSWLGVAAITLSSLFIIDHDAQGLYQLKEPVFPIRAVAWLERNPQQGNMFNDLNWGGYLGLHLWPDHLPFIDSMADTTGLVTRNYESIMTLRAGWQELFKENEITWAIIPPKWELATELMAQGWKTVYQDQTAVILIR